MKQSVDLREYMRRCPTNTGTVGQLREALAGLPGDTPLGEPRFIHKGPEGSGYQVFGSVHIILAEVKHVDGYRGQLLRSLDHSPPVSWERGEEDGLVIILGRGRD